MKKKKEDRITAAIKERNRQYQKASAAGKRVILAKEVLRLVKLGSIIPKQGLYLSADFDYDREDEQAQQAINRNTVECYACAKGALFVAAVSIKNRMTLNELNNDDNMQQLMADGTAYSLYKDTFGLVKLFGPDVTHAIEQEFEGTSGRAEEVLTDIMARIIKAKGDVSSFAK